MREKASELTHSARPPPLPPVPPFPVSLPLLSETMLYQTMIPRPTVQGTLTNRVTHEVPGLGRQAATAACARTNGYGVGGGGKAEVDQ